MATLNPLEQKARSSFIKGFVVALLIGIIASGAFGMLYFQKSGEEQERISKQKDVVILKTQVTSGQTIDSSMVTVKKADADVIPNGAASSFMTLVSYFGTENGGDIDLEKNAIVAKTDLYPNTILTKDMLSLEENQTTNDIRTEQYNMIVLPSDLKNEETIDVRLRLPTGQDYIVLSKKKVNIPEMAGVPSATTIEVNVSEDEILTMSAAIVDAYRITGSKLYAIRYAEPGMQEKATTTYIPAAETLRLIQDDPNIVDRAKATLINYYNENNDKFRRGVANSLGEIDTETQNSNLQAGTTTEVTTQKSEREKYLEIVE